MKKVLLLVAIGFVLISCNEIAVKPEEKKLEVDPTIITVYPDGRRQITTNAEDATFSSSDTFYASVDETGMVTGNKVGKTEIVVSSSIGNARIPITIMGEYSLYPDVDGLIGKSMAEVTAIMGTPKDVSTASTGSTLYTYPEPTTYTTGMGFSFKNGKCEYIMAIVSTSYTSMLSKHLIERYAVVGKQNDVYYFLNHDKDVVITLQVYNLYYLSVYYMPYTPSNSTSQVELGAFQPNIFTGFLP